jgi:hypothetical protein
MPHQRWTRYTLGAALLCGWLGLSTAKLMAQGSTTLQVTNNTANAVPVMITLGCCTFGISSISQLPSSWNITAQPAGSTLQGIFTLAGKTSVAFNSRTLSFSGTVAFGPTFTARGCGNSAANACYPNATSLAEFTLNMPGETVDISGVNGTNSAITINFLQVTAANSSQASPNPWNDGAGGNQNVGTIANQPITNWSSPPGVYGWQATTCTGAPNPPNPLPNCPAPVNALSAPQLQAVQQCNIQRAANAPTGGIVQVVFNGYTANSSPPPNCTSP